MKIPDSKNPAPAGVAEWMAHLSSLSDSDFITALSRTPEWEWAELDDLSQVSQILNRVDALLVSSAQNCLISDLQTLLDFSFMLVSASSSKSLYNSIDELSGLLDLPSWDIVFKTLRLIKLLSAGRGTKLAKTRKSPSLSQKLYAIALGCNIHCPSPVRLQDLCSQDHVEPVPFHVKGAVASPESLSENLRYVWLNRDRTNQALANTQQRQIMVACQLQALGIFLHLSSSAALLNDFCKTLPEIWLLPALPELIRGESSVEVKASAIGLLASILWALEGNRKDVFYVQFAPIVNEHLTNWDALAQDLLRNVAAGALTHPSICHSSLDFVGSIVECRHTAELFNLAEITSSLLYFLKNSLSAADPPHPLLLSKAVRAVGLLLPNTMNVFRECEGMATAIHLTISQTRALCENPDAPSASPRAPRLQLLKLLLKLIKSAFSKSEPVIGISNAELTAITESGLFEALNHAFRQRLYPVYEETLTLMTQLANEAPTVIADLVSSGVLVSLLESLEAYMPKSPKFIDVLGSFLCITGFNMDGARIIEGYNTISHMLVTLGSFDSLLFTSNTAASIAESLQELFATVPNTIDKAIDGHIQMVNAFKSTDLSDPAGFFQRISNLGAIFAHTFGSSTELTKGFINRGGVDYLLEVFKLPILPKPLSYEFYPLTVCFKFFPLNLSSNVLPKIIHAIYLQLQNLQEITGPISEIRDFSAVPVEKTTQLMHCLTEGDCYLEIIRVLLQNWAGVANNYKVFSELLEKEAALLKILIAEQARILCTTRIEDKSCSKFNENIDLSVLQNSEAKSLEENMYFGCQLTIRKVFRLAMKIPNSRGRLSSSEEAGLAVSRTVGDIFAQTLKELNFDELNYNRAYHLALQLSDIMKILLYDQGSTAATFLSFSLAGGTDAFSNFLLQLKSVSLQVSRSSEMSFHLVNGLQILWSLSGKFLESLVLGKYTYSSYGQLVIKALGFDSSKEVIRKMKTIALDCLKKVNYLECGQFSTTFARSVLDVLKAASNFSKEQAPIDSKAIKSVVDMGFPPQIARRALEATGSTSVELAMEWIFSHPEVLEVSGEPETPIVAIDSLHTIILNALPGIPQLSASIAELLLSICGANDSCIEEIVLTLLSLVGNIGFETLGIDSLKEVTAGMASIPEFTTEASLEQMAGCLNVIQLMIVKNPSILEIVRENYFSVHLGRFLIAACAEQNKLSSWIGNALAILNTLIKAGEDCSEEIVEMVIEIIKTNNASAEVLLKDAEMLSLLNLLVTITFTPSLAKIFIQSEGLKSLLLTKCTPGTQSKGILSVWGTLLKQLCEDPAILQASYEFSFLEATKRKIPLSVLLKNFKSQANRSKDIFTLALHSACVVTRHGDVYVEARRQRIPSACESWNTIQVLCESLGELFVVDQAPASSYYLSTDKLLSLLGDILNAYPRLIAQVLDLQLPALVTELSPRPSFLSQLVRNIIPFRFSLKLKSNKILLQYPASATAVSAEVFQDWVKACMNLLRALVFKQSYKVPDTPLAKLHAEIVLDNNAAVVAARKEILDELRDILAENLEHWAVDEKSMTLVRSTAMIVMQLLQERPKAPFQNSGCSELARLMISEEHPMIQLFSQAVQGISLEFKKAESMYNLLLAPLEILTKYRLGFALQEGRGAREGQGRAMDDSPGGGAERNADGEIAQGGPESIVIERWNTEIVWTNEVTEEENDQEINEDNESVDMEGDEEEEEKELDLENEAEIELEREEIEDRAIEREWVRISGRGRSRIREEEQEFRRVPYPDMRPHDNLIAERSVLDLESPQVQLNYRNIFREFEEGSMHWRDFENDDLLQALLQRNQHMNLNRQELPVPEPSFPRVFPDSSETMRQLSAYFSDLAEEDPVIPDVPNLEDLIQPLLISPEVPQVLPEPPNVEMAPAEVPANPAGEEARAGLPEGIDPVFLEALPEDIRNEILAQYQRPPRDQGLNEEFLQALPLELRNEVLAQNRPPPRPAAEMDNATFIASLTADLRREVLITANEEFLNTLPPDLVAEARLLQERVVQRDNYFLGRQPQIRKKQTYEEDKTLLQIMSLDEIAESIPAVEDSLLETLIKTLYLSNPVNKDMLSSLFLNLSVNAGSRAKILDGLVTLLLQLETRTDFPPRQLYGADLFLASYLKVYSMVSLRILEVLHHLAKSNPRVPGDLTRVLAIRLAMVETLRPTETSGFQDLISLMDQNIYRTSAPHLSPLILLITDIVNKLDTAIPSLDQTAVDRLCSLLSFESLNDNTVNSVVGIITKLSQMESNKEQVVRALRYQLRNIAEEVANTLSNVQISAGGCKELQLLRICKVLSGVVGPSEDINFLWEPLTHILGTFTNSSSQIVATANPVLHKLLPLLECFFLLHVDRSNTDMFRAFTEKNCKIINSLIRQNPGLLNDTFHALVVKFPSLLEFENKRVYFKAEMKELRPERGHDSIRLHVRRNEVFMDSFHQLKVRSPSEMHGKLRVQFVGEEGLDAGGLAREWFGLLAREMFNPNYALFIPSANGVSFQPNYMSYINGEHIQFFKFVGRIIGKALCDGFVLDLYFTRSFYKHILGQEVSYQDMEDLDVDFYKSLKALMEINLDESDLHEYYFAYEEEEFGKLTVKELVADGKNKRVTEDNKIEYMKLLCHMKMTKNIQAQIDAFKAGFHELVPIELVSIFDSKELELLISGLPTIDLDDLKANTEYHNYTKDSPVIVWMWETLEEFSREERAEFLQFVTGSSKVPLEGFKALPGMGGSQKFQIHKSFASNERLPTAHTCMNQLDLPEYSDKEKLRNRLKYAISEGKEGFGFV